MIQKEGYSIELIRGNIIYLKINGTVKINTEKVKEIKEIVLSLVQNKPFKNIVDFGKVSGILTNEAKYFIAKDFDFNKLKICDALITNSFTTSILIGIYLKLFTSINPTNSFSTIDEAFKWINKFD